MSATGSLMIRNLRKPADLQKAYMNQDQYLKIAASNDSNIANARRALTKGEVVPLTERQTATPDELQADIGKNESDCISNLINMGFRYDQASAITTVLTHQERVIFNNMFPDIKQDFQRKFNITRTTPTSFVEYLRKYIEIFMVSKGINAGAFDDKFNAIVNNIQDLRAILPTRVQFRDLLHNVAALPLGAEIRHDLNAIVGALPDRAFFDAVNLRSEAERAAILAELQTLMINMPTKAELAILLGDVAGSGGMTIQQKIDALGAVMGGISPATIQKLEDLVNGIAGGGGGSGSASALPVAPVTPILSPGGNVIKKMVDLNSAKFSRVATIESSTPGSKATHLLFMTPTGGEFPIDGKPALEAFFRGNRDIEAEVQRVTGTNLFRGIIVYVDSPAGIPYGGSKVAPGGGGGGASPSSSAPSTPGSGKGGVGIRIKKIGRGIAVEETPTYRQLGKYVIHHGQLLNDVLNVKYPSLGRIPQFLPTHISPDTKDFIMDLLDKGKVSSHHYDTLPLEDRKLFEKIMTGAGIFHKLGLKKSVSDDERADYERFKILKGEYMAGNNSVALMKELRRFIVKFMNEGKIRKSEGVDLLMDLSI